MAPWNGPNYTTYHYRVRVRVRIRIRPTVSRVSTIRVRWVRSKITVSFIG